MKLQSSMCRNHNTGLQPGNCSMVGLAVTVTLRLGHGLSMVAAREHGR